MTDKPPYKRGILLGGLDRNQRYVIGYRGRRWEILGPVTHERPPARYADQGSGARAARPAQDAAPDRPTGRHAARD